MGTLFASSKLGRRRAAFIVAAPLLVLQLLGSPPAVAADHSGPRDTPELILDSGPVQGKVLSPGSTATWQLGVTTRAVTLSELTLLLRAEGALAAASEPSDPAAATVQVQSCTTSWSAGSCPAGILTLIPRTPLGGLSETGRVDMPVAGSATGPGNSEVPQGSQLLVTVQLASSAPNSLQGLSAEVVARVDAAGEPWVTDGSLPVGTPGDAGSQGNLADTGFRLGGFLLLGMGAVATGMLAAAWGRARKPLDFSAADPRPAPGAGR